jgi:PP-loop superfamily ATP-utilizing enzyme
MEYFSLETIKNITLLNKKHKSQELESYIDIQKEIEETARKGEDNCEYSCKIYCANYIVDRLRNLGFSVVSSSVNKNNIVLKIYW